MNHHHSPTGRTWEDPFDVGDTETALRTCRMRDGKFWFHIHGYPDYLFEIWPGGRKIAWPKEMLEIRRRRQMPLEQGHKCRHAFEDRHASEPTAAGLVTDEWRQCIKCGEIREPKA
jgi:hypothetical protein